MNIDLPGEALHGSQTLWSAQLYSRLHLCVHVTHSLGLWLPDEGNGKI